MHPLKRQYNFRLFCWVWVFGELVSQMADAFWWVKTYRSEKNRRVVSEMTDRIITKVSYDSGSKKGGSSYTTSSLRLCPVYR
jgi:hypothetical protein